MQSIQSSKDERGVYYVRSEANGNIQTWVVGERYKLHKILGEGSFSCACLATDLRSNEKVALKRIGNVLTSLDNAKCVLREVCILRRLQHPNIAGILDAFLRPSNTGGFVYRNGSFVARSVDLYMALEYCDQGDLFHLRGQLVEEQVKSIMWQLLCVIRFLHSNNVWHRDIKSANILIKMVDGQYVAKLCDFGSARSAISEQGPGTEPTKYQLTDPESKARLGRPDPARGGLGSPLTCVVCTPCYRAPEVVMSHGNYSSALDLWSLGCVFGELIQRVAYLGKSSTPNLQVAPVIAVSGLPTTPRAGDKYEAPGNPHTRQELDALFSVVGTPGWATIESAIKLPAWKEYLKRIQGRAPQLFRRFGAAGEVALDLLRRLLEFDPSRRACADEALEHEYFNSLRETAREQNEEEAVDMDPEEAAEETRRLSLTGSEQGIPIHQGYREASQELALHAFSPPSCSDSVMQEPSSSLSPSPSPSSSPFARLLSGGGGGGGGRGNDSKAPKGCVLTGAGQHKRRRSFFELEDPSEALASLEVDLSGIRKLDERGKELLHDLLQRECEELQIAKQQVDVAHHAALETAQRLKDTLVRSKTSHHQTGGPFDVYLTSNGRLRFGRPRLPVPRFTGGLEPDPGWHEDPSEIGKGRIPHHADAQLADRDAEKHLHAGRHGEWVPISTAESLARSACMHTASWGVTVRPPGTHDGEDLHPGIVEAIRRQHAR